MRPYRPSREQPRAKVRISAVQLVCRKCGEILVSADDDTNEWDECEYPPDIIFTCDNCGKKHTAPNISSIINKVIAVRT